MTRQAGIKQRRGVGLEGGRGEGGEEGRGRRRRGDGQGYVQDRRGETKLLSKNFAMQHQ